MPVPIKKLYVIPVGEQPEDVLIDVDGSVYTVLRERDGVVYVGSFTGDSIARFRL